MGIAFVILRTFWKPLAIFALVIAVYGAGYLRAKRACEATSLNAQIAEMDRQRRAANAVLRRASDASQQRVEQIEILNRKVEAYEAVLDDAKRCILGDDDARRLHDIQ